MLGKSSWERFENTYELVNLGALQFSTLYNIEFFNEMRTMNWTYKSSETLRHCIILAQLDNKTSYKDFQIELLLHAWVIKKNL